MKADKTTVKKYAVPLQIIDLDSDGYHPLLKVKVFGQSFLVVLDTGASKTAFDEMLLLKANNTAMVMASDSLSTGLGTNTMISSTILLTDLYIGKLLVSEFEIAVLDLSTINIAYRQLGHPEILGVLGGDILVKYNAVIDYGKRKLFLRG